MQIRVMVCDDSRDERKRLLEMIDHYGWMHDVDFVCSETGSAEQLLAAAEKQTWDILFLDIYMRKMSGAEAAPLIKKHSRAKAVVFCTTSREHGFAGYEAGVSEYLMKPYGQEDVDRVLEYVLHQDGMDMTSVMIRCNDEEADIRVSEIRYIEIRRHTAYFHVGSKILQSRTTMDDLVRLLGSERFYRSHKAFLVNFDHVERIEESDFVMEGGERVPIGSTRGVEAKNAFLDYQWIKNMGSA